MNLTSRLRISVDVYEDLEKYPSHQKRYVAACKEVGIVTRPIVRMVDTRWTVIESCAARLFEQFAALEHMYANLSLSSKDTKAGDKSRLYRLVRQFTGDATPLLKLKLLFLEHVVSVFNVFIKILEKAEPMIHVQHELLGRLILTHMGTYIKPSVMDTTSYNQLFTIDHQNRDSRLLHTNVILPEPVLQLMDELGIGPQKLVPVFDTFMSSVLAFNAKCTERLMHYCKVQLTNKIIISLAAMDPSKRSDDTISAKVMYLQKFANVVPYTERERLAAEVRDYQSASAIEIPAAWSVEERETAEGNVEVMLDVSTYWTRVGQWIIAMAKLS